MVTHGIQTQTAHLQDIFEQFSDSLCGFRRTHQSRSSRPEPLSQCGHGDERTLSEAAERSADTGRPDLLLCKRSAVDLERTDFNGSARSLWPL